MNTYTRAVHDSRVIGIDFTYARAYPDFAASPIISATLTQSPSGVLTLGSPDVATTTNVVAFRVGGGTVGEDVTVIITAVNAAGDTKCETLLVITEDC
jgi:hypothetical protein